MPRPFLLTMHFIIDSITSKETNNKPIIGNETMYIYYVVIRPGKHDIMYVLCSALKRLRQYTSQNIIYTKNTIS